MDLLKRILVMAYSLVLLVHGAPCRTWERFGYSSVQARVKSEMYFFKRDDKVDAPWRSQLRSRVSLQEYEMSVLYENLAKVLNWKLGAGNTALEEEYNGLSGQTTFLLYSSTLPTCLSGNTCSVWNTAVQYTKCGEVNVKNWWYL